MVTRLSVAALEGRLPPPSANQKKSRARLKNLGGAAQRDDVRRPPSTDSLQANPRDEPAQLFGGARQLLSLRSHLVDLDAHLLRRSADLFGGRALLLGDRRDR